MSCFMNVSYIFGLTGTSKFETAVFKESKGTPLNRRSTGGFAHRMSKWPRSDVGANNEPSRQIARTA